jgi:N-acetylmuramoyl-L-alanine amidase
MVTMIEAAILCLATTLYHEARGEPLDGQLAVAEVILNRVEDPRWPSTVCEVVIEPRQFRLLGPVDDYDSYSELLSLAVEILDGTRELLSISSTHFYSGSKEPFWAKTMTQDGRIGGHLFFTE